MDLGFISEKDLKVHVAKTLTQYGEQLLPYDLSKANEHKLDPIKLLFDKTAFGVEWEQVLRDEVRRQRDKSNNNVIGAFHQNIFKYIKGCTVPDVGWDVVVSKGIPLQVSPADAVSTVFAEMKNKHNTMNSAASSKIYAIMQNQLLADDDCACFLVESIAWRSQNVPWEITVDKRKCSHRRIRRVSLDKFYALVTGVPDAFHQLCLALPSVLDSVVAEKQAPPAPVDTVFPELLELAEQAGSFPLALYMLGFSDYIGFRKEADNG